MFKNESLHLLCKFEENPPIFTKLSWKSLFYFIYFSVKVSYCRFILFKWLLLWVEALCYKIWSWLYMSLYILSYCLGFNLIMMFVCRGSAGLSGCFGEWFHMQSVGKKRNKYRCLFLWLVQCGTRGKCPSFCCRDFFVSCLNCTFILMSIINLTLKSIPFGAITCDRPDTADACITVRRCCVCCVLNCNAMHLAV